MKNLRRMGLIFVLALLIIPIYNSQPQKAQAFSPQVIQKGSTGLDVIELQARLQYIGFYKGDIDGIFGWGTYWALRNFQKDFGIKVDGLAGTKTKQKLVSKSQYNKDWVLNNVRNGNEFTYYGDVPLKKQTDESYDGDGKKDANQGKGQKQNNQAKQPAPNNNQNKQQKQQQQPKKQQTNNQANRQQQQDQKDQKITINNLPEGFTQNDVKLMSNAVYGESRGESYRGQVAVAAVILNRIDSAKFPDTVSGVIFKPGAFTAVADGQIYLTPNQQAKEAVMDALNGWDPSHGAIYYFNPNTATSDWIWSRTQIGKIGKHIFAK
ncbi:spore cortex-lytic enzyme [Tuberibacillus sp. Marseille-P3662]|uniref:spore cortex-lytic enzyme n=1 Tax=Tuberibacillus sp. Marseille-P3662 TaxID=1965358 RepID=UPI003F8F6AF4